MRSWRHPPGSPRPRDEPMDPAASDTARALKRAKFHLAYLVIAAYRRLPQALFRNVADFGRSLDYAFWVTRQFGRDSRFVATRERLWRRMLARLAPRTAVTVYEFGVAYGYTTRWWLARAPGIDRWYGFDTFRGLPHPWRHFGAGAFDANGQPPAIEDSRVAWVIGRVEDTFSARRLETRGPGAGAPAPRVFLFDLDLYEPTRCVAAQVFPALREGDLLYFDQAADWDERRALVETMGASATALEVVGATPVALALRAAARRGGTAGPCSISC